MQDFEYMKVSVYVAGDGFKPEVLKDLYNPMELHIISSTGEIAEKGRYKGKSSPYGMCYFVVPKTMEDKISLATTLYHRIKQLNQEKKLSIDDIQIDIVFSGTQGNMELTHEELKDLASVKSTVSIGYNQIKEE
jgi:hypothetical protein